ncbi:hydantoinase/oxoprolinase family protein [Streptomyces reniochalinae]|uniref:Hydantoinase/oxoprolinase family protein n=1 Tax=Streptomyces reniochalinae TaxID=2250578 RepID=A0A367ESD6_9ACTN|nr:hydantoinase/oxoprolinase family protein [Streptomyces reniochalinae]RCG21036.1 hydantoinase/oxoprolinase family protein [Streptomyces reniochalinae]
MLRIGIDVGGTFTDVTALDTADGRFHIHKLPSTTEDQSVAVAEGVRAILRRTGAAPGDVGYLGHGTTVATNTVLESDGARTALVTTAGLRDVLEIGRQQRPDLYDLDADKAPGLVPRSLVHTVAERMTAQGTALVPLSEEDADAVVDRLRTADPEAVAVCFLHSYRDDAHEREVVERLRAALPEAYVCASADVAPVFREFERFSTAVVNAYVGPRINRYMSRLAERIKATGVPVRPKVIGSSGGMMSLESVARYPVSTLLSGPSAGVVAASHVAGQAGFGNLITFDMGGTSTDVCLVRDGQALVSTQRRINGRPVRTPSLDIHTVGAGGGSIARVDPGGALEVGPASAGSQPGPAAYGRGGDQPTVTDANVLRGRLNPQYFLGGALAVDHEAAGRAVDRVAEAMAAGREMAARGIGRIASVNMAGAVRKVSVEAGEDPRGYVLVAFGGAGPLHAVEVAREVGMSTVVVPPNPGTLCALGLLVTDIRAEFARAVLAQADERNAEKLDEVLREAHDSARGWLAAEAPPGAETRVTGEARMRYARQNFELSVPLPERVIDTARFGSGAVAEMVASFHEQHTKSYGYAHADARVQIVEIQLTAAAVVDKPDLPSVEAGSDPDEALVGRREVDFDETGPLDTPVYERAGLRAGTELPGPAIVEQLDTTTVITPDATALVDAYGNLIIEVEQR